MGQLASWIFIPSAASVRLPPDDATAATSVTSADALHGTTAACDAGICMATALPARRILKMAKTSMKVKQARDKASGNGHQEAL